MARFGAVKDQGIVELRAAFPKSRHCVAAAASLQPMRSEEAKHIVEQSSPNWKIDDVAFLPGDPDPGKILCIGLNYRDHVEETGRTVTENPAIFVRFPESQVGHLQPIVEPSESDHFDYEGELAVVIGKGGRRIPKDRALSAIAGIFMLQ